MGQIRSGRALLDPDLAREQGCSKRALAEAMDGVGQSAVCGAPSAPLDERREPAKRAVCRGRRPLVTLGLSKVTRQAAQRRRNIFEGKVLASCMAKPCHPNVGLHSARGMTLAPLTLTLSPKGRGAQTAGCRGFGKPQKKRSLELRFLFLFPKHPSIPTKNYFPNPLHCAPPAAG